MDNYDPYGATNQYLGELKAQHDAGMQRAWHILGGLAAVNVLSGLYTWNRDRQQSPEALARQIAAEYGL